MIDRDAQCAQPGADVSLLQRAWTSSALDDDVAKQHSNYCAYHDGELFRLLDSAAPSNFTRVAHTAFRSFVLAENYTCLGARAALHRSSYRIGTYGRIDDEAVTRGLLRDLHAFVTERHGIANAFTTYAAIFRERVPDGEAGFEHALWSQLQRLHDLDRPFFPWDERVASDPASPDFSFSIGGEAFFVVGLHPAAERTARRFPWPTLVFNAHEQFEDLRDEGKLNGLKARIRARDIQLQGTINPNLADFGRHSEARQYAGREVDARWACPFRPK
jgi:FPC/CPF motif-containing protein YcgG